MSSMKLRKERKNKKRPGDMPGFFNNTLFVAPTTKTAI